MLARRRQAAQRRQNEAAASAASANTASALPTDTVGGTRGGSAGRGTGAIVSERLAAFAAYPLASLAQVNDAEEAAASVVTQTTAAEDITFVECRQAERTPFTHAILLIYLNIGSDPPDCPRIEPCAKQECWIDPFVAHVGHQQQAMQNANGGGANGNTCVKNYAAAAGQGAGGGVRCVGGGGGSEYISEALERQYRDVLHEDICVTRVLEANVDATRSALLKVRRMAREGRVLVHYNGHGMPRATELGEVWMLDKEKTHYVPLNILEMTELAGSPTVYVLDCNSAGSVLQRWYRERQHERRPQDLFICACGPDEMLPLHPALPADVLTACLTTPLKMALEWYIAYSHRALLLPQVTPELIRELPGTLHDRNSPLGELSWVLNAVLDTIAWSTLAPASFSALFRVNASVRALFRHALLADRLMRQLGCTPLTHPPLPAEAHLHPMWELWDYSLERVLSQLPRLQAYGGAREAYDGTCFFDSQLIAFEVWLRSGNLAQLPEQLPAVLLALSHPSLRVRALTLLVMYLDSGKAAGQRAILCGVLPYMGKLMTKAAELFLILTVLWMQVIRADPIEGCREMQSFQCEKYFTTLLRLDEKVTRIEPVEYRQSSTERDVCVSSPHHTRRPVSGLVTAAEEAATREEEAAETEMARLAGLYKLTPHTPPSARLATTGTTITTAATQLSSSSASATAHPPTTTASYGKSSGGIDQTASLPPATDVTGRASPLQPVQPTVPSPNLAASAVTPAQLHHSTNTRSLSSAEVAERVQQQQARGAKLLLPQPVTIAAHAVTQGSTVYHLMKDLDLARCKSMACYVLSQFLQRGERQCVVCWNNSLLNAAFGCLSAPDSELRSWACIVLARLFVGLRHAKDFVSHECTTRLDLFTQLLLDPSPIVRSSCVTLLACIVGTRVDLLPDPAQRLRRLQMEKSLLIRLRAYLYDASMMVREELIFFACQMLYAYSALLPGPPRGRITAHVAQIWQHERDLLCNPPPTAPSSTISSVTPQHQLAAAAVRWQLEETDVHVKSLLNAARPTVSTRFNDTVVFETTLLAQDDPLPSTIEMDVQALDDRARNTIHGLLHDAALMLFVLHDNCDADNVDSALRGLAANLAPQSRRFAAEALRTMSRVTRAGDGDRGDDAAGTLSEADRARATWNMDTMQQLVLDMQDRRLMPYTTAPATSSDHSRPNNEEERREGAGHLVEADAPPPAYHILPSVLAPESVVCTAMRALEPSMVVVTKDQRFSCVSYNDFHAQVLLHSFTVPLHDPVHDIRLINDLSEQSGLLIVNMKGGFSLVKGFWQKDALPTVAALFSACPPPACGGRVDIKCAYRSNTATLYYGGPIQATTGHTEIHVLSLAEEQVVQRLQVSGSPRLTCMTAHTTQRALLAGFADGVVRYYDDRQQQHGQLGTVGLLHCPPTRRAAGGAEAVVGTGPIATSTGFSIVAATRSTLRVFDFRKLNEAVVLLSNADLYRPVLSPSSTNARPGDGATAAAADTAVAPYLTNCTVGVHTGLVGLAFSNSTYGAYNERGAQLQPHPLSVTRTGVVGTSREVPILPCSCIAHPLRPMMSFGGELLSLHI